MERQKVPALWGRDILRHFGIPSFYVTSSSATLLRYVSAAEVMHCCTVFFLGSPHLLHQRDRRTQSSAALRVVGEVNMASMARPSVEEVDAY